MSELEQWAGVLSVMSKEALLEMLLKADIRLTAAHEQIGELRAELEAERRVKR